MLSSAKVCLLVIALVWAEVEGQRNYVNEFDHRAIFECPENEVLSYMGSVYSSGHQDRRWEFRCRPAGSTISDCTFTGYVNEIGQWVQYECPSNRIVNGMLSDHDNNYGDRRFMVQCCTVDNKVPRNCQYTDYINSWHQAMDYQVPAGKVIKGVTSKPCSLRRDRIWKLYLCDLN
ncbi:hypothetical protein BsWGS_25699 [Bradybaena similaris]